jgi:hypothetical protein
MGVVGIKIGWVVYESVQYLYSNDEIDNSQLRACIWSPCTF